LYSFDGTSYQLSDRRHCHESWSSQPRKNKSDVLCPFVLFSIFLAEMASEAQQQQQQHVENRKAYPNTAEAYQLIEPIGQGESAVVYR